MPSDLEIIPPEKPKTGSKLSRGSYFFYAAVVALYFYDGITFPHFDSSNELLVLGAWLCGMVLNVGACCKGASTAGAIGIVAGLFLVPVLAYAAFLSGCHFAF